MCRRGIQSADIISSLISTKLTHQEAQGSKLL